MKMKLLDYTLICLLSGVTPMAAAQATGTVAVTGTPAAAPASDATSPVAPIAPAVDCTANGCASDEGVLMRVRTRGERQPVTDETGSSSQALAPDRRVTVATEQPGVATATGKWSVQLPNGGVIWATEDPNLGQPNFNVSAPSLLAFDGGRIVKPVQFYSVNNYPDFIQRADVLVYRATDTDLVTPLATIPLLVAAVSDVSWDGTLPDNLNARVGDELLYIVRAYSADGNVDETYPRRMQLVRQDEVERSAEVVRSSVEKQYGNAFTTEQATTQSLIDSAYGENSLRQQNIGIYGSRIRIQGRNLPENYRVSINGQSQPVDLQRKPVAEYLVPVGDHTFDVQLDGPDKRVIRQTLDVDVSGKYLFAVALADVTASSNSASGSVEPFTQDDPNFDKSLIVDGRLAFYLKGKVQGKYLVTAQADTQEREVEELFTGFWDAERWCGIPPPPA